MQGNPDTPRLLAPPAEAGCDGRTEGRRYRVRYTVAGAAFGACLPAVACIVLAAMLPDAPATAGPTASLLSTVFWLHEVNPLLWVIDTAPLFLGLFGHFLGLQQDRICALNGTLQDEVEARTQSLREALARLGAELEVRQKLEEKLRHQALHDPLTGLANRALVRDRLSHTLRRAARKGLWGVSVLFLDLDDFKQVNDTLGHASGDAVLVQVAERLLSATRGSDTVGRIGGDEFAIVLAEGQATEGAVIVAERITRSFRAPFRVGQRLVSLGVSIGIASSCPGEEESEVLRNADAAMYRAKAQGKGGYVVHGTAVGDGVAG